MLPHELEMPKMSLYRFDSKMSFPKKILLKIYIVHVILYMYALL